MLSPVVLERPSSSTAERQSLTESHTLDCRLRRNQRGSFCQLLRSPSVLSSMEPKVGTHLRRSSVIRCDESIVPRSFSNASAVELLAVLYALAKRERNTTQ